jgi:hypothetical protein
MAMGWCLATLAYERSVTQVRSRTNSGQPVGLARELLISPAFHFGTTIDFLMDWSFWIDKPAELCALPVYSCIFQLERLQAVGKPD